MVYMLFSLLGEKAVFSGFHKNAALPGFELSERHVMDSSTGLSAQTASSLLPSHRKKNLSSGNPTQRLTWHTLHGINLLSQHCSLFPSPYF